jgi:uncharacterized membrane protein
MNKQVTTFFIDRILLFLVFFFPLIIVLRSAAINVTTTVISILILFNIFKQTQTEIFKNKLGETHQYTVLVNQKINDLNDL